ncbi:MAG: hypothetical protein KJN90_12960 [Gammaproteobacteria bacterium]|nr:hypothetical protein [Gammaproteobacteria bacterium]
MADTYKVVLGMAITKQGGNKEFFDSGLVYSNMHYDQMVEVERIFAKHAEAVTAGMQGMIADLVAMGFEQAEEREPERVKPGKNPGAIR